MASDKLMNHTQGETIITKLTSIANSLDDLAAVTPAKLGMGIATCDTAASTTAKTAALANFALVEGAPVSVKFTYANTAANATLNINNTGAKPIIYKNAAIGNDVISAGDTCTFIYTTNTYKITNIDTLTGPGSGTVRQIGAENGLITDQSGNADIQHDGKIGLNLKSTTAFSTEVGAHNTSTDNMYPVALDSEGHPVAAVPTMSASGSGHKSGLVPDPGSTAGTKKYLAENGEWTAPDSTWPSTPTDNTIPSSKLVKDSLDAKVAGPGSSTQNNIATYSDTSGKTVKDSGVHVVNYATGADTSKDDEVPTSKAVNKMITDKGYVVGPSSVTGDTIALFDSTTGKLIKSSSKTFDSSAISNDANKVPTSKLVYEGLGGKVPTSRTINDKKLSNNVTLSGDDLKLTNYSKTTSKDSLAANDKVNQAFDKLENRIVANQSNILLVDSNNGSRNLFNPTSVDNSIATINADKSVTVNYTNSTSDTYVHIAFDNHDYSWITMPTAWKGAVFSNAPNELTGGIFLLIEYSNNAISWANEQDLKIGTTSVTLSSAYTYCRIAVKIPANTGNKTFTVYPMIQTAENQAAFPTYQPYALPNYDLTYLEAEDRASLAEVVDSGAKNLLDTSTTTASNVTFTQDSNSYITASPNNADTRQWNYANTQYKLNLKAGTYIFAMDIKTATSNTGIGFNLYSSNGTSVIHSETSEILNKTGMITWQFTITTEGTYGVIYKCFDMVARLMVATNAAFGVSSKFVPYRPNYDLVVSEIGHHMVDDGNTNHSTATCNCSNWTAGVYLVAVNRYQNQTTAYGTALYLMTVNNNILPLFTTIVETADCKATFALSNDKVLSITYPHSAFWQAYAKRI